MLQYFLKKRLKKHDSNNNLKVESLVLGHLLGLKALNCESSGIGNDKPHNIVVSLTSYNKRIYDIYLCIESLYQQSLRADAIVLWLSLRDFPDRRLPEILRKQQARGLQIHFVENDFGPYMKYMYAFDMFPNSLIVTVDDDVLYPSDTIDLLYQSYLRAPSHIHCHRAHKILLNGKGELKPYESWRSYGLNSEPSPFLFATGMAGVLYPPDSLHEDAFNSEKFMELCPAADDVWLKAMSLLRGKYVTRVPDYRYWRERFLTIQGSQIQQLKEINLRGTGGNDCKIKRVFSEYQLLDYLQERNQPVLSPH
ncbi:hypothetical protein ACJJIC_06375 [Microbulbifer sp. ANSA002]|uniref:hypothetical protein n=1 Tax=unclassified Microbulbifer TaxID=2619833 RepID=UPI0040430E6D